MEPIYEGTFLNNTRSGFGKFYKYVNNIQYLYYLGYCHNGLFNKIGILYHANGNIFYSGDFNMGVFDGIGITFNAYGMKLYEGEFLNGNYHGFGVQYIHGQRIYEGSFQKNKYHGYGISYKNNHKEYEGVWIKNMQKDVRSGYIKKLIDFSIKYKINMLPVEGKDIMDISNIVFDTKESIQDSDYIAIQNVLMKLY